MSKERIVLIVSVLLLAWFVKGDLDGTSVRRSRSTGEGLEYVAPALPEAGVALPSGERKGEFQRDLFSPPSDTSPLAPLELQPPRLEPLALLAPPAAWGPVPARMGEFLREPWAVDEVQDLFGEDDILDGSSAAFGDVLGIGGGAGLVPEDTSTMSTAELAERTAAFKLQYDWILRGDYKFGTILNRDRFALSRRADEPITLEEVDPATGRVRFGGNTVDYPRDAVTDFGFADTIPNRLEQRYRLEFSEDIPPTQFDEALAFANECVELRLEAPRALEIAEDVFRRAETISDGDPGPMLGLASCFEAGFRFEEAHAIYAGLLAGEQAQSPVVHARMGDLLARFRVFARAEEAYLEGIRWGSTSWEARWRYGRFLLERGRAEEAVTQLEQAVARELSTPETRRQRTRMRCDHGWALLQAGRVAEARVGFERALSLEATDQEAQAGLVSVESLLGDTVEGQEAVDVLADSGFDLQLARGLRALRLGEWLEASRVLQQAASADPFRSHLALRSLAWLGVRTGNLEAAEGFVEAAYQADPTDTYTLYLRGRIQRLRDDLESSVGSFQAALDRALEFPEALAGMAVVQSELGSHEAAERYFERALLHDAEQPDVHARRGYNLIELGDIAAAEASFVEALRRDPDHPAARLGVAWCTYRGEDPADSLPLYADVIESRRGLGESDPFVVYAEQQIERLRDHLEKEVWQDGFERASGVRLGNGWNVDQRQGLEARLLDRQIVIEGMATSGGRTRIYRELPAGRYVSHEMTITVEPGSGSARIGLFLARERETRGESMTQAELAIGRSPDGALGYRIVQRGETNPLLEDLPAEARQELGVPMRLKIERFGNGSDARFNLYLDGVPVLEDARVPSLGSTSASVRFGAVIEIEANRSAKVTIDDVEVIRRKSL